MIFKRLIRSFPNTFEYERKSQMINRGGKNESCNDEITIIFNVFGVFSSRINFVQRTSALRIFRIQWYDQRIPVDHVHELADYETLLRVSHPHLLILHTGLRSKTRTMWNKCINSQNYTYLHLRTTLRTMTASSINLTLLCLEYFCNIFEDVCT